MSSAVLSEPLTISRGSLHCHFIYDVADKIDLLKALAASAGEMRRAKLELKATAAPSYIQFSEAPLQALIPDISIDGQPAEARLKIYDHGTLTMRITVPFQGSIQELSALSRKLRQSPQLADTAQSIYKKVLNEIADSMSKPYERAVTEDYYVFSVQKFEGAETSCSLLKQHRVELASLLSGETETLSELEQEEILRVHYSYFESDLAIVQWDTAFIYDESEEESEAAENIIEFANVQLVQYITYDARLDAELSDIYRLNLVKEKGLWLFAKTQAEQRAEKLRYVLVDIREISDHATNALKMIGDAYFARLYRGASLRLGLPGWQEQIENKMAAIQEIYQFTAHQSQYEQSAAMEMIIIVLIMVEVVIGVLSLI